jgi:hypothetical protein
MRLGGWRMSRPVRDCLPPAEDLGSSRRMHGMRSTPHPSSRSVFLARGNIWDGSSLLCPIGMPSPRLGKVGVKPNGVVV